MSRDLHDFERFMKERETAASAYVRGDAGPLGRLAARESPVTFFSPKGGHTEGAQKVLSTYEHDAKAFEPNGENAIQILHMAASDGIAYWVGFQRATAHLRGKKEAVPMNLRVTEVFRREGDAWKLIHRHADTLVKEP
jgi:ketosteroid isomerase-like protein